jgi:hypothetical protein
MILINNFFSFQKIFKSLPASLFKREEISPIQANLVPHFDKGGLGGICLIMWHFTSMIESSLILSFTDLKL